MDLPDLKHDYCGAIVTGVSCGPRREVTLTLELWPMRDGERINSWSLGEGDKVTVRFGGIENYEEVNRLFGEGKHESGELHYMRLREGSKHGQLIIGMEWDRTDYVLDVRCKNVSVSERV